MEIFRNKNLEIQFGLFGPALSYHPTNYDNAKLIVSLIFFKIWLTLPWKHYTKLGYGYSAYGFFSDDDPDKLIFQWGAWYKVWYMPWNQVVVHRYVCEDYNGVIVGEGNGRMTIDDCRLFADNNQDKCYKHYTTSNPILTNCKYYVNHIYTKSKLLKSFDLIPFNEAYEVNIVFDNHFCGISTFTFNTDTLVAINEQIEVQLMHIASQNSVLYSKF